MIPDNLLLFTTSEQTCGIWADNKVIQMGEYPLRRKSNRFRIRSTGATVGGRGADLKKLRSRVTSSPGL
jgi:hypothetical protein